MDIVQNIIAFIVALGILVTIHEFGHYWVAKRLGVKILRFSVGFGKAFWSRRMGPDNTEFVLASIPLGGYVKMLDEREGEVDESERARAFNQQPLKSRFAIVIAGPMFNFLFAILVYWLMFVVGVTGLKPVVGEVDKGTIAAEAGIRTGDTILEIEGNETPTWEIVLHASINAILDDDELNIVVASESGHQRDLVLDLRNVDVDDVTQGNFFNKIGMHQYIPVYKPIIGSTVENGPASRAGIQAGDLIRALDDKPVTSWTEMVMYIREHPGQSINIELERDGQRHSITITPESTRVEDQTIGRIGAMVQPQDDLRESILGIEKYSVPQALVKAVVKTWDMSSLTLQILGKILFGQASVENLSGPITIAQYAGQSASIGLIAFLSFLGIVSVSLGVLNLLPIPLLDGGHLLYYLVEFVVGKPLSESAQIVGQQIGMVVLFSLMSVAFYNDIMRIL